MWIIVFANAVLQTKTIILLCTKIISLAEIIKNKITLKKYTTLLTLKFSPVLFTNKKSDFLQCTLACHLTAK